MSNKPAVSKTVVINMAMKTRHEKILRMIHVKYASIFFNLLVFKKAFALTQSKPELRMASHALDV